MSKNRTAIGKTKEVTLSNGETILARKIYDGWAADNTGRGYDDMESLVRHESELRAQSDDNDCNSDC
jgi:hypothetical protein